MFATNTLIKKNAKGEYQEVATDLESFHKITKAKGVTLVLDCNSPYHYYCAISEKSTPFDILI